MSESRPLDKTVKRRVTFNVRPGVNRLHTFRSNVVAMTKDEDGKRLVVALANGKVYISNKKLTRWRRVKV